MLCPICGSEAFCDECINRELDICYADTLNQYLQTSADYLATSHDGLSSSSACSLEAVEV